MTASALHLRLRTFAAPAAFSFKRRNTVLINSCAHFPYDPESPPMAATPIDLYRVGNATHARLDALRNRDVVIFTTDRESEICVRAQNTTGISCYSTAAAASVLSGKIYRLPAGSAYDDSVLLLWEDFPGSGHWNWTPIQDVRGSVYLQALRDVDVLFG